MDIQQSGILNNPVIQEKAKRIIELMQDPNFSKACQNIVQYEDMKSYYVALILTFLGYGLIRYFALSKVENWIKSWMVSIILYLLFPFVLLGVSYFFFKEDLIIILKAVWSLVLN